MHWIKYGLWGWLIVGMSACSTTSPKNCQLYLYGEMPILNATGVPVVKAIINGHPVALDVDTGAEMTTIARDDVSTLDLENYYDATGTVTGVGGKTDLQVVKIKDLDMGASKAKNVIALAAGKFGGTINNLPIVGLFGEDFLGNYDTIIDRPSGLVKLVEVKHCLSSTPIWEGANIQKIPITHLHTDANSVHLNVKVDGKAFEALLDTGASRTVMSLHAARRLGVTDPMLKNDRVDLGYGITRDPLKIYKHTFHEVRIGDIVFNDISLGIVDTDTFDPPMILGNDFMKNARLWIGRDDYLYYQRKEDIPQSPQK